MRGEMWEKRHTFQVEDLTWKCVVAGGLAVCITFIQSFFFAIVVKRAGFSSFTAVGGLVREQWLGVSQMRNNGKVLCADIAPVCVCAHTTHSHLAFHVILSD